MATAEKDKKMAHLSGGPQPQAPIPQWPALPAFLKQRFPDKIEEIDKWHADCLEFFKKSGTISG